MPNPAWSRSWPASHLHTNCSSSTYYLLIACILSDNCLYTAYSSPAYYLFIVFTPPAHRLAIRSMSTHHLLIAGPFLPIPWLSAAYTTSAHCLTCLSITWLSAHHLYTSCQLPDMPTHRLSVYSLSTHRLLINWLPAHRLFLGPILFHSSLP